MKAKAKKKAAVQKVSKAPPVRKPAQRKHVTRKFEFIKMVASGNDFIVFDNRRSRLTNGPELAQQLCPRTYGIGADGLIFIEQARRADFRMRIFNPDGSEAEMCGNGIRCAALYKGKPTQTIETKAGTLRAEIKDEGIKIRMTDPKDLQLNINLDIDGCCHAINYVNSGVPHAVCFVEDLVAVRVNMLGKLLRYHRHFEPAGTNVDFVKILDTDAIQMRTYERGVEAETLACGTGAVAAALVYHHKFINTPGEYTVHVQTKGEEVLKVFFDYSGGAFRNVWLEGKARLVYKGECYV